MNDVKERPSIEFTIYNVTLDEMIPLTQERLEKLVATEQHYGRMIGIVRDMHEVFCRLQGYTPKPFFGLESEKTTG